MNTKRNKKNWNWLHLMSRIRNLNPLIKVEWVCHIFWIGLFIFTAQKILPHNSYARIRTYEWRNMCTSTGCSYKMHSTTSACAKPSFNFHNFGTKLQTENVHEDFSQWNFENDAIMDNAEDQNNGISARPLLSRWLIYQYKQSHHTKNQSILLHFLSYCRYWNQPRKRTLCQNNFFFFGFILKNWSTTDVLGKKKNITEATSKNAV